MCSWWEPLYSPRWPHKNIHNTSYTVQALTKWTLLACLGCFRMPYLVKERQTGGMNGCVDHAHLLVLVQDDCARRSQLGPVRWLVFSRVWASVHSGTVSCSCRTLYSHPYISSISLQRRHARVGHVCCSRLGSISIVLLAMDRKWIVLVCLGETSGD